MKLFSSKKSLKFIFLIFNLQAALADDVDYFLVLATMGEVSLHAVEVMRNNPRVRRRTLHREEDGDDIHIGGAGGSYRS